MTHHVVVIQTMIVLALVSIMAKAQYNDGYQMSTGYGDSSGSDEEERPKIHLGLKVKIPAFKFELPRMSLPKITISAKIKQPDRPRTITLPEINLDTSSRVAPPGKGSQYPNSHSVNDYGAGPSYSNGGQDKSQTFSFSTGEEQSHPNQYQNQYRPMNAHYDNRQTSSRYQNQGYSSTDVHPNYWTPSRFTHQNQNIEQTKNQNPDIGFNAPVYLDSNHKLGQGDQATFDDQKPQPVGYYRANNRRQILADTDINENRAFEKRRHLLIHSS